MVTTTQYTYDMDDPAKARAYNLVFNAAGDIYDEGPIIPETLGTAEESRYTAEGRRAAQGIAGLGGQMGGVAGDIEAQRIAYQNEIAGRPDYYGQAAGAVGQMGGLYDPGAGFGAQQFQRGEGFDAQQWQGGTGPEALGYDAGQFQRGAGYDAAGFDPTSVSAYMNPYETAAVQQAMGDIQRQGDIATAAQNAQSVQAGAFGGSRQGIMSSELGRNILEQQARSAVGMRSAGYQNAMAKAQAAFADQQRRAQAQSQFGTSSDQAAFEEAQRRAQAQSQFGSQYAADMYGRAQDRDIAAFQDFQSRQQAQSQFETNADMQAFRDYQAARQQESQYGRDLGMRAYEGQRAGLANQATLYSGIASGISTDRARDQAGLLNYSTARGNALMGQSSLAQTASNLLTGYGALDENREQARLNALYNQQMGEAYAPRDSLSWYSNIAQAQTPAQMSSQYTYAPDPSFTSQMIGLAGTGVGGYMYGKGAGGGGKLFG